MTHLFMKNFPDKPWFICGFTFKPKEKTRENKDEPKIFEDLKRADEEIALCQCIKQFTLILVKKTTGFYDFFTAGNQMVFCIFN